MAIDHMHTRPAPRLKISSNERQQGGPHTDQTERQQQHKRASSVSVRRTGWRLRAHRAVTQAILKEPRHAHAPGSLEEKNLQTKTKKAGRGAGPFSPHSALDLTKNCWLLGFRSGRTATCP